MTVGTFFIRVWRWGSIVGLVVSLISGYISFPNDVAVQFNENNVGTVFLDREVLFYSVVGLFLLNNVLINTIVRLFPRIQTDRIPVPNHAAWAANRLALNQVMSNWFHALQASVNTILALGVLVLSLLNHTNPDATDAQNHAWLLPLSTAIIGSVIISLPVRLLMKPGKNYD